VAAGKYLLTPTLKHLLNSSAASLTAVIDRAYRALQQGFLQEAENLSRKAVAMAPEHVGALGALALTLLVQSRHQDASEPLEQLVRLDAREPSHWINLGTVQRALRQFNASLKSYERAAALGASGPDFAFNVGVLQLDRGEFEAAQRALRAAHGARPRDPEIACQYARACGEALDSYTGIAALADWRSFDNLTTEVVAQIGGVLLGLGDMQGAEQAVQYALDDPSLSPKGLLQVILALERMNRTAHASELLQRLATSTVSELGEDLLLARARVAQREKKHGTALQVYEQLLRMTPEHDQRYVHLYQVAQTLDALGRYDDAFAAASAAHESQDIRIRRTSPELTKRPRGRIRMAEAGCSVEDVARWVHTGAPSHEQSPIFIVAFPRSGTTLLEQTLDAHPLLRSMDEQPYLQNAIDRLDVPGSEYPRSLSSLTREQLDEARSHYWSLVARRVKLDPGQRLIDKNPLNILRLPGIARLFPDARIILAIRHPLDVMLSCFMQHFRPDFAWHCCDMATLGLAYGRTMEFWYEQSALLAPTVMEIGYEACVSNFEHHMREVASFLELPWTDAMLEPAEHARRKGFISTPSYSQVVQPVHSRSVGRWRSYAQYMAPGLVNVQRWIDKWGYTADS
jgi:tetratricopeptide (TPR) repeat protein